MSNITKVSTTVLLCALLLGMTFTTLNFTKTDLAKTDIPPAYGVAAVTDLKCYSTNDPTDPPEVTVTDQFGTERIDPGGFPFLCTSTVKNDEGTLGELHWNAYPTAGTLDPPPVTLTDQFGSMLVDPGTAAFLMAPVIKNGAGDLKAPHFKCYNMVGTIDPPIVSLADQFVTERVDPFPAVDFCTPALKNGEGTLDAPHLICYAIFGQFVGKVVTVEDQFGTRTVEVGFGVLLYTLADKKLFEGRMTGGGSVTGINAAPGGGTVKVTHGFELHCVATQVPNNLQVNWDKGNKFHLESLTTATCSDDGSISEVPPVAGFDTYKGTGTGRYNGVSGAMAEWEFTDEGEPGKSDKIVMLKITDASNIVVLDISGLSLTVGNHQAHAQ